VDLVRDVAVVSRELADMIRDSWAEESARLDYEARAAFFFEREDRAKRRGDTESAEIYHGTGVFLAHVARSETVDRQPAGLG